MLFERAMTKRGLPPPNVVVETSDLAVLRGVLLNTDLLTAISPRQLSYELAARLLTVVPIPLRMISPHAGGCRRCAAPRGGSRAFGRPCDAHTGSMP
jgi:LysR family transcriptional regulator of gallate degradation